MGNVERATKWNAACTILFTPLDYTSLIFTFADALFSTGVNSSARMKMISNSTPAATASKKPLSKDDFELICFQAARDSINCKEYISSILENLYLWLKLPDGFEPLWSGGEPDSENIQILVISLYHLLEEKCVYDFDVVEVLNTYSAESHQMQPHIARS